MFVLFRSLATSRAGAALVCRFAQYSREVHIGRKLQLDTYTSGASFRGRRGCIASTTAAGGDSCLFQE